LFILYILYCILIIILFLFLELKNILNEFINKKISLSPRRIPSILQKKINIIIKKVKNDYYPYSYIIIALLSYVALFVKTEKIQKNNPS
jgi:hypothetical protein